MKNQEIGIQVDQENISTSGHDSGRSAMQLDVNENPHDRAYKHLESLEQRYADALDSMYKNVGSLIKIVGYAPDFHAGLESAVEKYKLIKDEDKESFILIQFLEEFYERYAIFDQYHTVDVHEHNFKDALSLAYNAIDNHELLGNIYDIPDHQ